MNVELAKHCINGYRTYNAPKKRAVREGEELLTVYGTGYWGSISGHRGGCTQLHCTATCPWRLADDEMCKTAGDLVVKGRVRREVEPEVVD